MKGKNQNKKQVNEPISVYKTKNQQGIGADFDFDKDTSVVGRTNAGAKHDTEGRTFIMAAKASSQHHFPCAAVGIALRRNVIMAD